jgi:hypothetical protein
LLLLPEVAAKQDFEMIHEETNQVGPAALGRRSE